MISITDKRKFLIDGGFCVIPPKDSYGYQEHTHDFAEFSYIFGGKCIHNIDGVDFLCQKGDLIFINYGSVHTVKTTNKVNYSDVLLKPEYIDKSLSGSENAFSLLKLDEFNKFDSIINKQNCVVHFDGQDRQKIELVINWLCDEQNKVMAGNNLVLKSLINLFLTMVFRKMALPMYSDDGISREVLKYIKDNIKYNISMSSVANMCGYNPSYFSRLFKKTTGLNFTDYVMELRISDAINKLINTDKSVEQIILDSGFSDRTKFFKMFLQKTGQTPKEYRKSKNQIQ